MRRSTPAFLFILVGAWALNAQTAPVTQGGERAPAPRPPGTTGAGFRLQAESANTREIVLTWSGATAKESRLERKSGPDMWTTVTTTSDGKATDTKIGPFGTYQYRVVSGPQTSNVITVGPPPTGFHTIAPRPDKHPDTAFGKFVSPVLDSNGDPAVVFVYADPNGDGRGDDTELMFASWDRASYSWREPVSIGTVGNFDPRPPMPCVAVARDSQSGTLGVAWVDPDNKTLHLALSRDGGDHWLLKTAFTDTKVIAGPSLVFAAGKIHLALEQDGRSAITYITGGLEEEPDRWKATSAPMLAGYNAVSRASSLALDDKGSPAIAYWQKLNNATVWALTYWRPGGDPPVKITDTGTSNYPPDGVLLVFAGSKPRIMLDSRLDRAQISSHYSAFSDDGGVTWSKPLPVPDDGNEHIGGYMSFAVAPDGRAAFAGDVAGGNTDRMKCSWPKLARTTTLTEWTTCAPQGAEYRDIRTLWGSVLYAPSGVLYMLFQNRQTAPQQGLPAGLLIWGGH